MTPEQRYLFDVTGYLHIEGAVTGDALKEAQEAVDRYIHTPLDERPEEFTTRPRDLEPGKGGRYEHGFAFDRSLEAMTVHPAIWPLVKEFTFDKPRFVTGTLTLEQHNPDRQPMGTNPAGLHCAREGRHWLTRYEVQNNQIYCNDFVAFFYLTDVQPGDGGLIVIPGSHKSKFERPEDLLTPGPDGIDPEPDDVFTNLTPKAGDFLVISELLTHGVLRWKPKDRDRRFLILRYRPQYDGKQSLPEKIVNRLTPEVQELVQTASYGHTKELVKQDVVKLTV